MGRKTALPDRWTHYLPLGKRIPGTRFIAFKVPLKESFEWRLPPNERFSPRDLITQVREQQEELGLIIDLTYTTRYYEPKELPATLQYCKILTVGHEVPNRETVFTFKSAVKKFLMENQHNDKLVGVHCTHGLNRTGYLVCRYLIDVEGMDPNRAIELFNRCRGHVIERKNYIEDLLGHSDRGSPRAVSGYGWMRGHVRPGQPSDVQVVDYRPQKLQPFPLGSTRHFPCPRSSNEEMPRRSRPWSRNSSLITCCDPSSSACGPQYPLAADTPCPRWDRLARPAGEPVPHSPYQQQWPAPGGPSFPRHNPHSPRHPGRCKTDRRSHRKTH